MFRRRRSLVGGMIIGGTTGAIVGHYTTKKQFESMQRAQAQQAQLNQAQTQAAQAQQAAQEAQRKLAQTGNQAQASDVGKSNITRDLEKLVSLKEKGIISDEEFQQMKTRLLSSM